MAKIVTSKELFQQQAPNFNFELGEKELLEKALEKGFVKKIGDDQYQINDDY